MALLSRLGAALCSLVLSFAAIAQTCPTEYMVGPQSSPGVGTYGQPWVTGGYPAALAAYCSSRGSSGCVFTNSGGFPIPDQNNPPSNGTITSTCPTGGQCSLGAIGGLWSRPTVCSPEGCPKPLSQLQASMTSTVENISEAAAKALTKQAGAGKYAECSADSCVIVRQEAVCGGLAGVWRCEFYKGGATAKTCSGTGGGFWDGTTWTKVTPEAGGTGVPKEEVAAAPPGPGKCPGEFNGQTIYVPCDSSTSSGTVTSVTSTGSGTLTVSGDTTTTCKNGTCTTVTTGTTTVTTSGGSGTTTVKTGSTTVAESEATYCVKNPQDTVNCKDGKSTFSGTCSDSGTSSFTCGGDAATCAIAKAVNESNCLLKPSSAVQAEANKITSYTWAGTPATITKTVASFDQANPYSTGCPADYSVRVAGQVFMLPLSQGCTALEALGNLLVAFTLVSATIFVLKGFGSS